MCIPGIIQGCTTTPRSRAYRAKLKASHPDKGGTREAFQRVQRAYAMLCGREAAQVATKPPGTWLPPQVPRGRAALLAACTQEAAHATDSLHAHEDSLQTHDTAVAALVRLRGVQHVLGTQLDQRLGGVLRSRAALQKDPHRAQVDREDAAALLGM